MFNAKYYIIFLIILIIHSQVYATNKKTIAVLEFKAKGITSNLAKNVTELLYIELVNSKKFTVVERIYMDKILKEQGLQQTGCTEETCAVEVGKLLSAQKILVGSVMKVGDKIIITSRVVDIEKGVGEAASKQIINSINDLDKAVTSLITDLIGLKKSFAERETGASNNFSDTNSKNETNDIENFWYNNK